MEKPTGALGNNHKVRRNVIVIRGVNKNIIEISDTGNENFERAILFVRPDSQRLDADTLHSRAAAYLSRFRLRPWFYSKGQALRTLLKVGAGAAIGAVATAALFLL